MSAVSFAGRRNNNTAEACLNDCLVVAAVAVTIVGELADGVLSFLATVGSYGAVEPAAGVYFGPAMEQWLQKWQHAQLQCDFCRYYLQIRTTFYILRYNYMAE